MTTTAYLSEDDLQDAIFRFGLCAPNRAHVARVLRNLADWSNANSDGWCYWPAPRRAAQNAMGEIHAYTITEIVALEQKDLTDRQVRTVLAPVKTFTTRQINRGLMTLTERDRIFAG